MMTNSPEPMSLGSPTQSPTGSGSSNYLPQFLLGDPMSQQRLHNSGQSGRAYWPNASATHSPPRGSNLMHNHHHLNHTHHYGATSSLSRNYSLNAYDIKLNLNPSTNYIDKIEPGVGGGSGYGPSASASNYSPHSERSHTNLISGSGSNSQVPGAPPVNRLVDILNKPTFNATGSNTSSGTSLMLNTPNESRVKFNLDYYGSSSSSDNLAKVQAQGNDVNRLPSPPSPTQIDPFYAYGETIKMDDKLDETWITVFGFPQSATSYVLQEFSIYGQIVKYTPNAQGNWLHIKYQTKLQAQKALSKNGKVLSNSLMIGVMPCIDKMVMNVTSPVKDQSVLASNSNATSLCAGGGENVPTSPSNVSNLVGNKSGLGRNFSNTTRLDRSQSLRTGVRPPLGQFNRNLDPNSANDSTSRMPKKNTNVISKAMEFMFGW